MITIPTNGNVGIGTQTPDAKLAVKGDIHTQEVKVDLLGSVAPDYVFAPDYNLVPLSEVESYIKANKHLPEVPSAKQMEEEGLKLKEMNLLLLKKVEELTLHLIEMKRRMVLCSNSCQIKTYDSKKLKNLQIRIYETSLMHLILPGINSSIHTNLDISIHWHYIIYRSCGYWNNHATKHI